jgi:hypothetical protein
METSVAMTLVGFEATAVATNAKQMPRRPHAGRPIRFRQGSRDDPAPSIIVGLRATLVVGKRG